ncbi:MAG: electron transport complex subunit RsxC [Clostridiaceae bacterium]|nr:electron transport complex subunit RsxC [Clostridiaceae bacterium]
MSKRIFKGGVAVPHEKTTAECETVMMGVPEKVVIPMLQHIGAPCKPLVKKGDIVKVGQLIGQSEKYVSAPIHSSVSGTVTDIVNIVSSSGSYMEAVEIKTDGKQEIHEDIKPPVYSNDTELLELIKQSGLVGLGGAGFPAHVKLSIPDDKKIDILIVNGAECEPYITSDYREILENSWNIVSGINILIDLLKVDKVLIGIEDNKPEAIKILSDIEATNDDKIDVVQLKSRYPQGAEKMLIYSMTGRKVPPGKLPMDVGVVVMNVSSVSFVAEYVKTGMPLIKKRVTVDGPAINKPANVEVYIGTPLIDVFNFCGGLKENVSKVIMGGPMMGVAQGFLDNPVLKNTNALLAFDEEGGRLPAESACIRCGKCIEACPMNLLPLYLNQNALRGDIEGLKKFKVTDCIECGSCSFVCPAKRRLVQSMRLGKALLRKSKG